MRLIMQGRRCFRWITKPWPCERGIFWPNSSLPLRTNSFAVLKPTSNGSLSTAFPVQVGVLEHTQPNTHPPIGAAFARPPPSRHPTSGDRLIARSVRKHRPSAKKGIRHGFECIIRSPWFKPWPWLRTLYSPSHLGLTTVILKFTSLYYLTGPSAVVLFLAGHLIQPLEFWERITSARVSRRLYHSSSNPTPTFGIIYTIPVAMATPSNVAEHIAFERGGASSMIAIWTLSLGFFRTRRKLFKLDC